MSEPADPTLVGLRRILCDVTGPDPGPTLLCIAGLHGNEPAGVLAVEQVAEELRTGGGLERGRFVAVAGNLAALAIGERWVESDLNRGWRVPATRGEGAPPRHHGDDDATADRTDGGAEAAERAALRATLDEILEGTGQPVVALDFHTTSSHGPPFALIGDTVANRAFASRLGLPIVLGLEELVDGTLLDYLHGRVAVAVGVEGGQHEDPASVTLLERVIRTAVVTLGLREGDPDPPRYPRSAPPRFLEVRHRQAVDPPEDGFRMRPGYVNFQPVGEGEVVADDREGTVRVPERGRLLMPLYQRLGEDGFFVVRPIRPFWIRLSGMLRGRRADRWVHLLPGVQSHPSRPDVYVVNRRIARWYALEIFHLLGYRRVREQGGVLLVTRR